MKDSVDWNEGDEIAIATTGNQMSQKENEKRTIKKVSSDGLKVTLTEPLEYIHMGTTGKINPFWRVIIMETSMWPFIKHTLTIAVSK